MLHHTLSSIFWKRCDRSNPTHLKWFLIYITMERDDMNLGSNRVAIHRSQNSMIDGWRHDCCQRSEEHTSELQSRGHLVCRLLLEKKKRKWKTNNDSE